MRVAHMPAGKAAVVAESLRKLYNSVDDDVEVRLGGDKKIQDESGIFLRSRRGIDDRKPYYAFITFERRSTDETINKIHKGLSDANMYQSKDARKNVTYSSSSSSFVNIFFVLMMGASVNSLEECGTTESEAAQSN